jgi:hypothetical protein
MMDISPIEKSRLKVDENELDYNYKMIYEERPKLNWWKNAVIFGFFTVMGIWFIIAHSFGELLIDFFIHHMGEIITTCIILAIICFVFKREKAIFLTTIYSIYALLPLFREFIYHPIIPKIALVVFAQWVNSILIFIFHYLAYLLVVRHYPDYKDIKSGGGTYKEFVKRCFDIQRLGLPLLFPSYYSAKFFKSRIDLLPTYPCSKRDISKCYVDFISKWCECQWEMNKHRKRDFIIFSNWINVIKIICTTILIMLFWGGQGWFTQIIVYIFILHLISRSYEIITAFYNDVVREEAKRFENETHYKYVNRWRNSSITRPTRISLAIHSLLEMILSFALLYYILFLIYPKLQTMIGYHFDITSYSTIESYMKFLLYSASVSIFNVSYDKMSSIWVSIIHVWQVGVSLVLIILSLAAYLNLNDKLTKRQGAMFFKLEEKRLLEKRNEKK